MCNDLCSDASITFSTLYIVLSLRGEKSSSLQYPKYWPMIVDRVTVRMIFGIVIVSPLSNYLGKNMGDSQILENGRVWFCLFLLDVEFLYAVLHLDQQ